MKILLHSSLKKKKKSKSNPPALIGWLFWLWGRLVGCLEQWQNKRPSFSVLSEKRTLVTFPGVSGNSDTCWVLPLQVRKPKWVMPCTCCYVLAACCSPDSETDLSHSRMSYLYASNLNGAGSVVRGLVCSTLKSVLQKITLNTKWINVYWSFSRKLWALS